MSISRVKVWSSGEVLTANDLNNEFNNITNNVLLEPFVATQQVDINGQLLLLDADGDTYLDGSTNNTVDVTIANADDFRFTANTFAALSGSNISMVSGDVVFTAGRVLNAKGANVASAGSITVPTDGNVFDLTGTTTITSFSSSQAGTTFLVRYTGTGLNLIYNATSLITPFATDYRLTQNEVFYLVSLGSGNYYVVPLNGAPHMEVGTIFPYFGTTAPTGALLCDGLATNCTTYYALAKKLIPAASTLGNSGTSVGNFTVNTGNEQISLTSHGLAVNDIIHVTNSGGSLPAGLSANTVYFVNAVVDANTITVSATRGGSSVDITTTGSGTHTLHSGFNVPDLRGRTWVGLDNLGGSAASRITSASTNGANSTTLAGAGGAQTHTLAASEIPSHNHMPFTGTTPQYGSGGSGGSGDNLGGTQAAVGGIGLTSVGSGGAHSNTQPWMAGGYAIRY